MVFWEISDDTPCDVAMHRRMRLYMCERRIFYMTGYEDAPSCGEDLIMTSTY